MQRACLGFMGCPVETQSSMPLQRRAGPPYTHTAPLSPDTQPVNRNGGSYLNPSAWESSPGKRHFWEMVGSRVSLGLRWRTSVGVFMLSQSHPPLGHGEATRLSRSGRRGIVSPGAWTSPAGVTPSFGLCVRTANTLRHTTEDRHLRRCGYVCNSSSSICLVFPIVFS